MRKLFVVAFFSVLSVPAMASCDALKQQIDAKLQAKGVKAYTLEIEPAQGSAKEASAASAVAAPGAPAAQKGSGKVVGTCDGGSKQIVYKRG